MKRLLPIIAFLCLAINGFAQNWNPFTPGVKRYFLNSNNYLRGMRIDSVVTYGSDLHYYPFRTPRNGNTLGSWLGMEVIEKSDGSFLFPNYWDDTITLKPFAVLSDSWLFFQDDGTKYYNATVTGIDTMTILGSLDSIKRIVINAYDNGQPLVSDSFNNVEIILSKENGFYAIMDLYMFPYHEPNSALVPDDYFLRHSLVPVDLNGLCIYFFNDTVGPHRSLFRQIDFTNPSSASMHDWNVGDVYEYAACFLSSGNVNGCTPPWYYGLDTVVAKNMSTSGVEYITHGWRATVDSVYYMNAFYSIEPFVDTIFYSSTDYLFSVDFMPEEYLGFFNHGPFYFYFPGDTSFCTQGDKYYTCYDQCGISWVQTYRIDKAGVGPLHHNRLDASQGMEVSDSTLLYFVKNGVPCGTFVSPQPMSVNITLRNDDLKFYPNPAYSQFTVETSFSNYNLSLLNIMGQAVYTKTSCDAKEVVNVEQLPNGIYYLKLETGDQKINRKVLIQH